MLGCAAFLLIIVFDFIADSSLLHNVAKLL